MEVGALALEVFEVAVALDRRPAAVEDLKVDAVAAF